MLASCPPVGIALYMVTFVKVSELRWPSPVRREPGALMCQDGQLVALCASGVQISPSALGPPGPVD